MTMRSVIVTLIEYPIYMPPLGSAYITASLKRAGYEAHNIFEFVKAENNAYSIITSDREERLSVADAGEVVSKIESLSPDIVGFSCYVSNRQSTTLAAKSLRERNPKLVIVGGGPDIHPAFHDVNGIDLHKEYMDYFVQGEGEERIVEFIRALEKGERVDKIAGVYDAKNLPKSKSDQYRGYTERIKDLDGIPIPDFTDEPRFERFRDDKGFWYGIPINISRGCTGNCSFCNRNEYFKKIRFRSAESVFKEMLYQHERYRDDFFAIVDDDPLASPGLPIIEELCEKLIERPDAFYINMYNAKITRELADKKWAGLLRMAGVRQIQFGVESFSPAVRKHMAKPQDSDVIDKVIRHFSRADINTCIYLIYGYPTETETDFEMTIEWLKRNAKRLHNINVNNFILSEIFERKKPKSFRYVERKPGHPLSYWESEHVNIDIMWERYYRIKETLENYYGGYYSLADPAGNYIHGRKQSVGST
ncbi:MAG: hypothetical protein Kow0090_12250 [Myxococcota bacterium]